MNIPSALTAEEKQLKVVFENIRNTKKALDVALSSVGLNGGAGKVEQRTDKMSIEDADLNTAELKKKVLTGMITVKKQNEKQTFKRARAVRKGSYQSASTQKSFDLSTELNAAADNLLNSGQYNKTQAEKSHSFGQNEKSEESDQWWQQPFISSSTVQSDSTSPKKPRLSETAEDGELTDD
ncbi:Negative elongation factor E [Aphelenchoides besseyi]|nr:Negative elongation factor E [Aphelenchoides besseyi]